MSKSKFNVVDPLERSKTYTSEGMRYFLLREGVAHSDGSKFFKFVVNFLIVVLIERLQRHKIVENLKF